MSDDADGPVHVVVFGLGSYGDALQITPLLHQLRRRIPSATITLVHPHRMVRSLLEGSRDLDEIVIRPSSGYEAFRSELALTGQADLIVNCRYVIEYLLPLSSRLTDDERLFVEQAQEIQVPWGRWIENFPYDNDRLWQEAASRGMNMYSLMAATSGFGDADFEELRIELAEEDFVRRRELPARYVVVCNSAEALTITRNRWTKALAADKMARIVKKIRRFGAPSVLLGSTEDPPIEGVDIDWRGKSSIREAAAILADAALYLGPEGGLANLAKAVKTPAIIFFGSTPPEFFAFRGNISIRPQLCGGCWWTTPSYLYHCPRLLQEPECTRSIDENDVAKAVRRSLS